MKITNNSRLGKVMSFGMLIIVLILFSCNLIFSQEVVQVIKPYFPLALGAMLLLMITTIPKETSFYLKLLAVMIILFASIFLFHEAIVGLIKQELSLMAVFFYKIDIKF